MIRDTARDVKDYIYDAYRKLFTKLMFLLDKDVMLFINTELFTILCKIKEKTIKVVYNALIIRNIACKYVFPCAT